MTDLRVASARILGREVGALLLDQTLRERVVGLLVDHTADDYESPFVQAMGSEGHPDFAYRLRCLRALQEGVEERVSSS